MAIYNDYLNRQNKVGDIAAKYHIMRADVARIAVEMGAKPRCEKRFGKHNGESAKPARICPKCRKSIDVNGARFCCFCGSDIRTSKQICLEGLERIMPKIMHLPENMRDEFTQTILMTIKELNA